MNKLSNTSDVNNSFIFPYRIGDEQKCITDTEKELRFLINAIMTDKFGSSWMSNPSVFRAADYDKIKEMRQKEAKTLTNNPVLAAELLEYCYIHDLKDIIDNHWEKGFHEIFFPSKKKTLTMLQILSELRNPQMHGRGILFLHQKHLCLGIAGEILSIVEQWRLGFRQQVKSYQCVFRFKPPKNGGSSASELTREEFMKKTSKWIDDIKATATHAVEESDNNEIVHLLTFSEGSVRISFGRDRVDGDYGTEQRENKWYTTLIVESDNLDVIDRIVREADRPYWVYKINLKDKLNASNIKSRIEEKTGQEITGGGEAFIKDTSTGQNISTGGYIEYPFGKLKDDAIIKVQLSSGENEDSKIQIWFVSGGYDDGFYLAHKLFSYNVILLLLYGEITPSKIHQLIKDACTKPSTTT